MAIDGEAGRAADASGETGTSAAYAACAWLFAVPSLYCWGVLLGSPSGSTALARRLRGAGAPGRADPRPQSIIGRAWTTVHRYPSRSSAAYVRKPRCSMPETMVALAA
jgi:hypothetical protein